MFSAINPFVGMLDRGQINLLCVLAGIAGHQRAMHRTWSGIAERSDPDAKRKQGDDAR